MAKIRDVESLLFELEKLVKIKFNQRLTAICTEKKDDISLNPVSEEAWFFQSLDDGNHNFDPFILWYVDGVTARSVGKSIARNVSVEFDIFLVNDQVDPKQFQKKILRYQRALEESLCECWDKVVFGHTMEIQSLTPVDVRLQNNSFVHKVFGVTINFELA